MKSPRERNILIAVLIVAGLGLAIDRVILDSNVTSPAESSAGVVDGFSLDPESLLIQPSAAPQPMLDPGPSFADRLRLAIDDGAVRNPAERDAFALPLSWQPKAELTGSGNAQSLAAEAFKRQNNLEAVLTSGEKDCAVVNGQTLYLGDSLQGYRLVAVHARSAEFESNGVRVMLGLRGGGSSS